MRKLSADVIRKLPYKQQIGFRRQPLLSRILKRYQKIGLAIPDPELRAVFEDIFRAVDVPFVSLDRFGPSNMIEHLLYWQAHDYLVLFSYRPTTSGSTILTFLRSLRGMAPLLGYENIIPLLSANPGAARQKELFRVLGQFGIRFACFTNRSLSAEQNVDGILGDLENFIHLEQTGFAEVKEAPSPLPAKETKPVIDYVALLAKGDELMAAERFAEAIKLYSEAIEKEPAFDTLMRRGDAYYAEKNYPAALQDYRTACELAANLPVPFAKVGSCCFTLAEKTAAGGHKAEATGWFDKGLNAVLEAEKRVERHSEENSHQPELLPSRPYDAILSALTVADMRPYGMGERMEEMTRLAGRVLQKTKEIDYRDDSFTNKERLERAILLVRSGFFQEGEELFEAMLSTTTQNIGGSLNAFARELRRAERFGAAFKLYVDLIGRSPVEGARVIDDMREAGKLYANALREAGATDEALAVFDTIISFIDKSDGLEWLLCEKAICYLEKQEQGKAAATFIEALYLNPNMTTQKEYTRYGDLHALGQEVSKKFTRGAL